MSRLRLPGVPEPPPGCSIVMATPDDNEKMQRLSGAVLMLIELESENFRRPEMAEVAAIGAAAIFAQKLTGRTLSVDQLGAVIVESHAFLIKRLKEVAAGDATPSAN